MVVICWLLLSGFQSFTYTYVFLKFGFHGFHAVSIFGMFSQAASNPSYEIVNGPITNLRFWHAPYIFKKDVSKKS